ncbi:hypothetical protein [Rathayibacter sp. AY1B8]|uniref:hypothetical protein n=1 Tax=Rathayibacter sp. AY1B8 TaxID=2080533 RepID=UPI0011B0C777|nr:hypothetical protein [Rathayibacter sp. AY1B8]
MTEPFPEGCPPDGAEAMDSTFYRLANRGLGVGDVAGSDSWLRPYETKNGALYKKPEDPEAHGLSLYADLEELGTARDLTPWMARKSVAEVTITPADGWLRNTPIELGESHHDWWTEPFDLIPSALVIEAKREAS